MFKLEFDVCRFTCQLSAYKGVTLYEFKEPDFCLDDTGDLHTYDSS